MLLQQVMEQELYVQVVLLVPQLILLILVLLLKQETLQTLEIYQFQEMQWLEFVVL